MVSPGPQLSFPPPTRESDRSYSASPSRFSFNSRSVSRGRSRDDGASLDRSISRSLSRSRLLGSRSIPVKDVEKAEQLKYSDLKEIDLTPPPIQFLSKLPPIVAHFLGYRSIPSRVSSPFLPFLNQIPLQYETYLLSFLGAFCGILVIIAISVGLDSAGYGDGTLPLTFASLGATAVLLFGVPESPLSQPRNVIVGNVVATLIGISVSMLFSLSPHYAVQSSSSKLSFEGLVPVAAALAMSLSLVLSQMGKFIHPPAGAIAVISTIQPNAVGQHYKLVLLVVVSVLGMEAVACIFGNLGRRRYPSHWISPNIPVPVPTILPPSMKESENSTIYSFSATLDPPREEGRVPLQDVGEEEEEETVEVLEMEDRGRTDERRRGYKSRT